MTHAAGRTGRGGVRLILLAVAALVAVPGGLSAQSKYFGAVAGANLSDLSDEYGVWDTSDRWGANFGLVLGIRTVNRLAIAFEPAYSQMGGEDIGLDYLETPITFGGLTRTGDATRVGFYTGLAPAFKLSCEAEQPAGACDNVKGSSWFLPLGMRFYRQTSPGMFLGLDIRYLVPLGSSVDEVTVRQRTWSFRLVLAKGQL